MSSNMGKFVVASLDKGILIHHILVQPTTAPPSANFVGAPPLIEPSSRTEDPVLPRNVTTSRAYMQPSREKLNSIPPYTQHTEPPSTYAHHPLSSGGASPQSPCNQLPARPRSKRNQ